MCATLDFDRQKKVFRAIFVVDYKSDEVFDSDAHLLSFVLRASISLLSRNVLLLEVPIRTGQLIPLAYCNQRPMNV